MASYDKNKLVEGKYTVKHLMKTALDVVKTKTTGSIILDVDAEARFPKFQEAGRSTPDICVQFHVCPTFFLTTERFP